MRACFDNKELFEIAFYGAFGLIIWTLLWFGLGGLYEINKRKKQ